MNSSDRIQFALVPEVTDGLDFVRSFFALSKNALEELVRFGAIYRNQKRWLPDEVPTFQANDLIRVHLRPKRFPQEQLTKIRLVAEHRDWIAAWKPAGVPSHPTLDNQLENVKAALEAQTGRQLWGLSRLDVGTRGLLLLATSHEAARVMNLDTLPGSDKIYVSLGHPPKREPGLWTHWMKKTDRAPRKLSASATSGHTVRCDLEVLGRQALANGFCRQDLKLLTGRTHQIRVQMAFEGGALLGDALYGGGPSLSPLWEEFALSCERIEGSYKGQRFSLERPVDVAPLEESLKSSMVF